jgi:hypothetical protein
VQSLHSGKAFRLGCVQVKGLRKSLLDQLDNMPRCTSKVEESPCLNSLEMMHMPDTSQAKALHSLDGVIAYGKSESFRSDAPELLRQTDVNFIRD